ncbi:MAG: sodium:solute symporter family transporter, partial [Armatimonadota bacterium]
AARLAAQMSTLSAFMVAGSALITRNLYLKYIKPGALEAEQLRLARWAGLVIVVLGVAFAFVVPGVADALVIFWDLAALTGLFMWGGVLWRRANPAGAWASFIAMLVVWLWVGQIGALVAKAGMSLPYLGAFPGKMDLVGRVACYLPLGVVVLVVVSLLTRPHDKKALDDFYMLLRTPVGHEEELKKAGVNVVYAGASEPHPWEVKHPTLVNVGGFLAALAFSLFILGLLYLLSRFGAS